MIRNLWLVHPDEAMASAFRGRFAGLPGVRVIRGRFEDLGPHDCFVTAGNAFGLMTAGIDAAVVRAFGEGLMERVQHVIMDSYFGEQPVGTAFVVPTRHARRSRSSPMPRRCACPAASRGPTRSTPRPGPPCSPSTPTTLHPRRRSIETVAFPGDGPPASAASPDDEAARQMAAAYRHYLEPPHRLDWDFVVERHKAVCYDGKDQVAR